jgi:hypothetical protein
MGSCSRTKWGLLSAKGDRQLPVATASYGNRHFPDSEGRQRQSIPTRFARILHVRSQTAVALNRKRVMKRQAVRALLCSCFSEPGAPGRLATEVQLWPA